MTKEEREQARIVRENSQQMKQIQATQKELSATEYKQKARFKALEVAQYLKPPVTYVENSNLLSPNRKAIVSDYDVVAAAEKIYQWLIKVIK